MDFVVVRTFLIFFISGSFQFREESNDLAMLIFWVVATR